MMHPLFPDALPFYLESLSTAPSAVRGEGGQMTTVTRRNNRNGRCARRGMVAIGIPLIMVLVVAFVTVLERTAQIRATPSSPRQRLSSEQGRAADPTTKPGSLATATILKVVILSDTHGKHREVTGLPDEADALIFAGDFTAFGNRRDAVDFNDWLGTLPYAHKIVVAGNHDGDLHLRGDRIPPKRDRVSLSELPSILTHAAYLQDSGYSFAASGDNATAPTVRVWGSPWQPQFAGFETYRPPGRGHGGIARRWDLVPDDTALLVVHTPPRGTLDSGRGCVDLASRIAQLKSGSGALRLVAFGHFHQPHGTVAEAPEDGGVTYVNAAIADGKYRVAHEATVISLTLGGD